MVEPSIETGYQISLCKLGLVYILAIYASTVDYDLNTLTVLEVAMPSANLYSCIF